MCDNVSISFLDYTKRWPRCHFISVKAWMPALAAHPLIYIGLNRMNHGESTKKKRGELMNFPINKMSHLGYTTLISDHKLSQVIISFHKWIWMDMDGYGKAPTMVKSIKL